MVLTVLIAERSDRGRGVLTPPSKHVYSNTYYMATAGLVNIKISTHTQNHSSKILRRDRQSDKLRVEAHCPRF